MLRDHLERNELIKKFVKTKREEVLESDDKVMLHVDWAENGTIIVPNEIQTTFYGGRTNYSIHSGYQYAKENSGGFGGFEGSFKSSATSGLFRLMGLAGLWL